jgi:hypothetical protein
VTSGSTLVLGSGGGFDLSGGGGGGGGGGIVVRDASGEFEVGDPVGMLLEGRGEEEGGEEEEGVEGVGESEFYSFLGFLGMEGV